MKTVGVVSLQGDVAPHRRALEDVGCAVRRVREPKDLTHLAGVVIPGGESTTIGMLMERFGLLSALRDRIASGLPVLGTCAGAILLSAEIVGSDQPRLGSLPVTIRRNAYGRQVDSFEADIAVAGWDAPLRAIFIRAPQFEVVPSSVAILASHEARPVAVQHGATLALTFHPELTDDRRFHRRFVDLAG